MFENLSHIPRMPNVFGASLSSLYAKLGIVAVIALAGAGVAAYLFRENISDAYFATTDQVIETLGLGIVPIALWVAVFLFALRYRRSWFRQFNLWFGSIAIVFLTLGIMAFFQPFQGSLATFTLDGEVTLGGNVGESVIGSASFLGGLRLFGIFVIGIAIVSPAFAVDVAAGIGRAIVYAYVLLVLAIRATLRRYRNRGEKPTASTDSSTAEPPVDIETTYSYSNADTIGRSYIRPNGNKADLTPQVEVTTESSEPTLPVYDEREPAPDWTPASERGGNFGLDLERDRNFGAKAEQPDDLGENEPDGADLIATAEAEVEEQAEEQTNGKFNRFWTSSEPADAAEDYEGEIDEYEPLSHALGNGAIQEWARPSRDLLQTVPEGGITNEEMRATADNIVTTLSEYGIEVEIGQIKPGPTVTMYGLTPGWVRRYKQVREKDETGKPIVKQVESKTRVKVDSIISREKDLALALKTPSIRIETPVMGQSLLGIEVPNPNASLVTLRAVMESKEFSDLLTKAALPIALGKGSGGETAVIDLAKMPHLLVAGATGSGKSVCLNTIISCLIMEKTPAELRMLLIDPKRVELTPYNGIPHLLAPVVVETDKVVGLLKGVIHEMMSRYKQMEGVSVRNIEAYNRKKIAEKLPYLVVVVDELADLMMTAAFDVEQSLCRLAQLGRATGIHLIVATQRPSVDVVTGLIKANFPSRISFGVTSYIDSRTILDTTGAEKLLGRGDMLYLPIDGSRPERVQGVFISDKEIENVVGFWQTTPRISLRRISLHAPPEEQEDDAITVDDSADELLEKAIELALAHNKVSTSLLQRRMRIGYPRAARLMDDLEERGVVGPSDGSKSRDVIMNNRQ